MKKITIAFIFAIPLIANAQNYKSDRMNQDSTSIIPNTQMMSIQNSINSTTSTSTSQAITNGRCGVDNGGMSFVAPTALCTSGIATAVTLTGNTYSWSCVGSSNGSTASCSASKAYYGSCGSDNGQNLAATPTNLCTAGTASAVTLNGSSYNWTCKGNTGAAVACSANSVKVTCGYWKTTTLSGGGNHQIDYWGKCSDGHIGTETVIGGSYSFSYTQSQWPRMAFYTSIGSGSINGDTSGSYGCPNNYTHKIVSQSYNSITTACVPN